MLFRNDTQENVKYRLGSLKSGFRWFTVRPAEVVDIPEMLGDSLNLTKVGEADGKTKTNQSSSQAQSDEEQSTNIFKKSLLAIKGLGKRTAEKIIALYPSKDSLKKAVEGGAVVHSNEEINNEIGKLI